MHYLSGKNVKQLYKFLVRICQLQIPNQPKKQGMGNFEENHPHVTYHMLQNLILNNIKMESFHVKSIWDPLNHDFDPRDPQIHEFSKLSQHSHVTYHLFQSNIQMESFLVKSIWDPLNPKLTTATTPKCLRFQLIILNFQIYKNFL